jgi:UDP-N-acetylglucosamine 2-epimerase (non-hydrolysing)
MRILCVAGARPNFMKIQPVLEALDRRGADAPLVHTGQHYDASMSDVFFDELRIRRPDFHLGVGSGTHAEQTARVMTSFEQLVRESRPSLVVVVGDVNSTMACAVVAAKAGCLVAHVEAGLRSRDWTMPEEVNRVVTDRVSDILLAPSQDAVDNLRAEGRRPDSISLVGNVMVDTLLANVARAREGDVLERLGLVPGGYGLVTLHRPANVDEPDIFNGIVNALTELSRDLPLVFPVHPRTKAKVAERTTSDRLILTDPMGYLDFLALEASARLVLTDSGGVQEETTVLGVPCLTLRDNTERPITITHGTNRVVGRDPARIASEARAVLEHPPRPQRPELWDGQAGERIAEVLLNPPASGTWPRPTEI